MFFYSSLLLSDPGEELQDGSCHPGVGRQRLSDFRQDPSWGAQCLAWPLWSKQGDALEESSLSRERGVGCTDPEAQKGEMGLDNGRWRLS